MLLLALHDRLRAISPLAALMRALARPCVTDTDTAAAAMPISRITTSISSRVKPAPWRRPGYGIPDTGFAKATSPR
jgi:hypothetical protein